MEELEQRVKGLGRQYRYISRETLYYSLKPRPHVLNLPKRTLSAYIQLKTGKGYLRTYQHMIRKAPDNKCYMCSGRRKQSTKHLILECKVYKEERQQLRKSLKGLP